MTYTVINQVHNIADAQKAPGGITFGATDGGEDCKVTILDIKTDELLDDDDNDASNKTYRTKSDMSDYDSYEGESENNHIT